MSGIFSPITNEHRYFESSINTTPIGTGLTTSDIWVTVPFVNFGKVSRIILTAHNGVGSSSYTGNVTVGLLKDGAASRLTNSPVVGVANSLSVDSRCGVFEFHDTYYEDIYRTRKLYVRINGSIPFQQGLYFNVKVGGTQQQPYWNREWETNYIKPYKGTRIYRQLSNGSIYDLSSELSQNGDPYTFGGSVDTTKPYTVLSNSSEYFYIGSDEKFDTVYFDIPTAYRIGAGNTIVAKEYWNGSAWAPMTKVNDNTSNGQYPNLVNFTDSTGFNFSGALNWITPSDWSVYNLPNDPMVLLRNGINTGAVLPIYIGVVRPKYWIRFSVPGLTQSLSITRVAICAIPQSR